MVGAAFCKRAAVSYSQRANWCVPHTCGTVSEAKSSLPLANTVTAEKGMAGRNPPLMLLPAKFGPIRDSPGVHGRFLLLVLA